ncbi:MAG TPA: SH3 domain-containing protein [Firmicutes bacterium]|nr:SH3 domain-containing protein [Bacillota bacterium]
MGKAVIVAFLSILFYLTNLLGGGQQQLPPVNEPAVQHSYGVLGQQAIVLPERAVLRHAPDSQGEIVGTIMQNEAVLILDERAGWYKIKPESQTEGWIPKYAVGLTQVEKSTSEKIILGYYSGEQQAYESLLAQSPQLTGIAPLRWRLTQDGTVLNEFEPEKIGRGLYFAGNQKLGTYAYLGLPPDPEAFLDQDVLWADSFAAIENAITEWGLKGVLLDSGALTQKRLFDFASGLRTHLREQGLLTLLALEWEQELDWAAAAEGADLIIVNTADLTAAAAGPLASTADVREMLSSIVQKTAPEKIILGLANVGLDWSETGQPTVLSHGEVLELAARRGADIKWDNASQTPYFRYGAGHEVWFENRYSIKHKLELAAEFRLAGVAFMQFGLEDPDVWNVLAETYN